jgi:hypothetical protein
MPKLLLSIMFVAVIAPIVVAKRRGEAHRSMRRMLWFFLIFNAVYITFVVQVYFRFYAPEWFH